MRTIPTYQRHREEILIEQERRRALLLAVVGDVQYSTTVPIGKEGDKFFFSDNHQVKCN